MKYILKKVLSAAKEFVNKASPLSLMADSILDRIVPQAIARADCVQWRDWYSNCGACTYQGSAKMIWRQYRVCDLPPGQVCATTTHCGPWQFHHSIACCSCVTGLCNYF